MEGKSLGGIIGRPDKNFRLAEAAYLQGVAGLLRQDPHVLLMHLFRAWSSPGCRARRT